MSAAIPEMHPTLRELVQVSAQRKWMSYEELNTSLPDEMVDPEKLDELLVLVDQLGVSFIDEPTVRRLGYVTFQAPLQTNLKFKRDDPKKTARIPKIDFEHEDEPVPHPDEVDELEPQPEASDEPAEELDDDLLDEADTQAVIQEAINESGSKRIDDPIRMYLTQMGTIPLLTREEEIRLAKKIETTRMIFRRRVLESDYAAQQAVDILQQVHDGNLPFDRTMRISTAEENAKDKIAARIPVNLCTVRRLLELNRDAWDQLEESDLSESRAARLREDIIRRRRKMATLLEECCLRTSRIQPLFRKLQAVNKKIKSLQRDLEKAEKHPNRYDEEDVYVMREELNGLRSLVVEDP
ncbi:MAG TPA: sigma-70 factor domain-containing protein, partial [Phycisphaerales bacterium]|nr:sigma-70 factor domain-containing protein [Phycisphaerales bacterium]